MSSSTQYADSDCAGEAARGANAQVGQHPALRALQNLSDGVAEGKSTSAAAQQDVLQKASLLLPAYRAALRDSTPGWRDVFQGLPEQAAAAAFDTWGHVYALWKASRLRAVLLVGYLLLVGQTLCGLLASVLELLGLSLDGLALNLAVWFFAGAPLAMFFLRLLPSAARRYITLRAVRPVALKSWKPVLLSPTHHSGHSDHPFAGAYLDEHGELVEANWENMGTGLEFGHTYLMLSSGDSPRYVLDLNSTHVVYQDLSVSYLTQRPHQLRDCLKQRLASSGLPQALHAWAAAQLGVQNAHEQAARADRVKQLLQQLLSSPAAGALGPVLTDLVTEFSFATARGQSPVHQGHIVLKGNPGTGKTTTARQLGRLLHAMGMAPSTAFVEVGRSALVGANIGQTEQLTEAAVAKAAGGVLFIDEAYTLVDGSPADFGLRCIETLMSHMENNREHLTVVVAGYSSRMTDFLASNPGLASRFKYVVDIPDFTQGQLKKVFLDLCVQHGVALSNDAVPVLDKVLARQLALKSRDFGNAREVRSLFERVHSAQKRRVLNGESALPLIDARDFDDEDQDRKRAKELAQALAELNALTGLGNVKQQVLALQDELAYDQLYGEQQLHSCHYVFTGNPGTGKTTVARILARILCAMGFLPSTTVVEVDRSGLVAGYVGQTAQKTNQTIDRAMGGVLFIDEAYALANRQPDNDFGHEAIEALLKRMEDDRGKFVVIAAGYPEDMQRLLGSNEGLRSRFTHTVHFEDYSVAELVSITKGLLGAATLEPQAEEAVARLFTAELQAHCRGFSNGRFARNMAAKLLAKMKTRVMSKRREGAASDGLAGRVTLEDVTAALGESFNQRTQSAPEQSVQSGVGESKIASNVAMALTAQVLQALVDVRAMLSDEPDQASISLPDAQELVNAATRSMTAMQAAECSDSRSPAADISAVTAEQSHNANSFVEAGAVPEASPSLALAQVPGPGIEVDTAHSAALAQEVGTPDALTVSTPEVHESTEPRSAEPEQQACAQQNPPPEQAADTQVEALPAVAAAAAAPANAPKERPLSRDLDLGRAAVTGKATETSSKGYGPGRSTARGSAQPRYDNPLADLLGEAIKAPSERKNSWTARKHDSLTDSTARGPSQRVEVKERKSTQASSGLPESAPSSGSKERTSRPGGARKPDSGPHGLW